MSEYQIKVPILALYIQASGRALGDNFRAYFTVVRTSRLWPIQENRHDIEQEV